MVHSFAVVKYNEHYVGGSLVVAFHREETSHAQWRHLATEKHVIDASSHFGS